MFGNLMGKLQEVQQKAEEAKAALASARYSCESDDSQAAAVVDGNGRLVSLHLHEELLAKGAEEVQAVVLRVVTAAQTDAATASAEAMKSAAKSLLPGGFPGL
jgi:DNA-binding protein YbaB